ncbi:hypothetical protein TUM3792_43780 [Shewanella sp. MBTL60-007]|nr:hypothetical protein TUM3792_43780 [Shewanella sp. MBTL60-007]
MRLGLAGDNTGEAPRFSLALGAKIIEGSTANYQKSLGNNIRAQLNPQNARLINTAAEAISFA